MTNNKYIIDTHTHTHTHMHAHTRTHSKHTHMWKHTHASAHIHSNSGFSATVMYSASLAIIAILLITMMTTITFFFEYHFLSSHLPLAVCLSVCVSAWLGDFSPLLSVIFHYIFQHWVIWVHGVTKVAVWDTWEPTMREWIQALNQYREAKPWSDLVCVDQSEEDRTMTLFICFSVFSNPSDLKSRIKYLKAASPPETPHT